MKQFFLFLAVAVCLSGSAKTGVRDSKTNYAREALQPYVERGPMYSAFSSFCSLRTK